MKNIVINGQFFIQKQTGQQRFAKEILSELDKIIGKNEIIVIVPKGAKSLPLYNNIKIIAVGEVNNRLWEQLILAPYLLMAKKVPFNFCNTVPILKKGPTVIHDLAVIAHREYFNTWKGKIANLYYRFIQTAAVKSKYPVLTVSEFSKNDIIQTFNAKPDKVVVIPNAWQHFGKIETDNNVLDKYFLKKNKYFFSIGSCAKHKNFEWIYNNAKYNPLETYIIAGGVTQSYKDKTNTIPQNVKHIGYISDAEVKGLMTHCKAFIFPSFFEGFGIPPLEALSVGAPIIISDVTCLPEIFEDSASYIDPKNAKIDINSKIMHCSDEKRLQILSKYSWEKSARLLYDFLKQFD